MLIVCDFDVVYWFVDVLVLFMILIIVFWLGEKVDDLLVMYLFDLCMLLLNLVGYCGMFVLLGFFLDDGLLVGL